MSGIDQANRKRDARLRFRFLDALHQSRGNEHGGWVTLRFLVDVVGGFFAAEDRPRDDQHALSLLRDLTSLDFALEEDNREEASQPFLEHLTFKISGGGIAFVERALPPTPLIDDGRMMVKGGR